MTAQIINNKKMKLAEEKKSLEGNLKLDYEALGLLVSENVVYESGVETIDFSNLLKEPVDHQMAKILQKISQKKADAEFIEKKITELDSLKTCHKCGAVVDDDELFCSNCGERLVKDTIYTDNGVCPHCGRQKKGEGPFCVYCGFKFNVLNQNILPAERVCVKCGTKLPEDVLFCHICGCKQPDKEA